MSFKKLLDLGSEVVGKQEIISVEKKANDLEEKSSLNSFNEPIVDVADASFDKWVYPEVDELQWGEDNIPMMKHQFFSPGLKELAKIPAFQNWMATVYMCLRFNNKFSLYEVVIPVCFRRLTVYKKVWISIYADRVQWSFG